MRDSVVGMMGHPANPRVTLSGGTLILSDYSCTPCEEPLLAACDSAERASVSDF